MAKNRKIFWLIVIFFSVFLILRCSFVHSQGITGNVTNKTWNVKHALPFRGYDASNKKAFEVRLTDSTYFNTFVGVNAGAAITTGTNNTFMGYMAGKSNTTADNNTFVGTQAGYINSTGGYNTFMGYYAGLTNSTGGYNTFMGYAAGYSNSTGVYNTFIGTQAGLTNSTGPQNTFMGYAAGYLNSTGGYNTFMGYYAGRYNSTGPQNTFMGAYAGFTNSTGGNNTFVGYTAGYSNSTGAGNTYIGDSVAFTGTISKFNNFVGVRAGEAIVSGSCNNIIGYQAGRSLITGNYNLFMGHKAGYYETGNNKFYIANQSGSSLANGIDSALIYGDFNARTLRVNAIISGQLPHGVFSADSVNVTAVIAPTGHYTKMLPVMVQREADYLTFAGDTITILKAGDYEVYSNMCVTTSNASDRMRVKVFKNGVPYSPELGRFIIRSEGTGIASSHGYMWYATGFAVNDRLSFYITNLTAARNAVISDMKVIIKRIPEN